MNISCKLLAVLFSFTLVANGALPEPGSSAEITKSAPPPSAPAKRSAAELEKLAMPVALHPDPLIAILLPASVYPLEMWDPLESTCRHASLSIL